MKKTILLPLLVALCFAIASADEYSDARKKFESAFRPQVPSAERIEAVFCVANFDTRDAAKLLISGVGMTEALLAPLHERKGEVDEELERILGSKMFDEQRTLPSEQHARVRVLKRESASLQDEIDGELKVFRAIEDGLSSMRSKEVVEYLAKSVLLRGSTWKARQIAAAALGEIADPAYGKHLIRALKDNDERVQVAAAVAVGRMGLKEGLKDLLSLLSEKNWTVRSAAIQALGEIGEKGAVGALIDQLEKEEGRLQRDCADALAKLTGEDIGPVPGAWRKWWDDHKDEYGGEDGQPLGGHPVAPPGGRDGGYYGIPIETHRAIFVLDVSGSMAKSTQGNDKDVGAGEISKIESAKRELIRALKSFPSSGCFNLVVFNDIVKRWKEKMVPSTPAMKKEVETWVQGLEAASSTNIYDALDAAFRVAGMGAHDKNYDLGADTIFLLSDGSPTKPDGSLDDWEKILRAVAEWNRLKRVVVHTIGIGGHNAAFMSRLAAENGGTYVAR